MTFEVEITTLRGFILATTRSDRAGTAPGGGNPVQIKNYSGVEVEIPISDSRTARATFSLFEQVTEKLAFQGASDGTQTWTVAALGRMLRVYYRTADEVKPVFWGPILMQTCSFKTGTVEVNAVDPTLRLKHHYANYSDDMVGPVGGPVPNSPLDYRTVRELVEAAQNLPAQNNYPPLGILSTGFNDAPTAAGSTIKVERGDNIWDRITEIKDARYGPDIEFEPRDSLGVAQTDDLGGTWPYYCQLNTYEKQGTDRSGTVIFIYSDSEDATLEDLTWEPSGDIVRNQVTIVTQGTDSTPGQRVFGHDLSAWKDVGIFAAWENPEGGNAGAASDAALQDWAADFVHAQARPPQFLTIMPKLQSGSSPPPFRYRAPYKVGDEVQVLGDKGYRSVDEVARITKVTLKQADQAGNVREELELVPKVTNLSNVSTGTDS